MNKRRVIFLSIAAAVTLVISAVLTAFSQWSEIFVGADLSSIYTECEEYPFSIFFFNVGSGNCILVHSDSADILVDSGLERVQSNVLEYLEILDIDSLDLLVLTHPDKDHIGNMADVAENIEIKRFVTCENGDYELTDLYNDLIETLENKGVSVEYTKAGDKFAFGDLILNVVSPTKVYDESNNNSVALKVNYRDFSVFLSGDIESEAEQDILQSGVDISADVLCVAHHGSGSSTEEEFLNEVSPECAVISVEQNEYLPNNKVLSRLINYGCTLYRTDKSGSIAVVSTGESYKIITEYKKE